MFKDISKKRITDRRSEMKYNKNTINLSIADSDFATPSFMTNYITQEIKKGDYAYRSGHNELPQIINKYLKKQNKLPALASSNFFYGTGVIPILQAAINLHTNKNDYVLILNPIYGPFIKIVKLMERQVVFVNIKQGKIDFTKLAEDIKKYQIKLFLFCNPHNPTGKIFKPAEMQKISQLMQINKGYIYCDEVWADLILNNDFKPFASVDQNTNSHIVTINGLGKGFILQALRFGYAYCFNQKLIADLTLESRKANYPLHLDVTTRAALKGAYSNEGLIWLKKYNALIKQNFEFVKTKLVNSKIIVPEIEATHVLWLDFKKVKQTHQAIAALLKKANLILSDGLTFGPLGNKKFRLNLSTNQTTLALVMAKLKEIKAFN